MHLCKPVFCGLLLLILPLPLEAEDVFYYVAKLEGKADGKTFTFKVTSEDLKATPSWSEDQESPPVSARKAIEKANALLEKLVKDTKRWELHQSILERAYGDKWYWVVEYYDRGGKPKGFKPSFHIMVLMDGAVVKPTSSEDN
jgi:hypothetical protein